MAQAWQLQLPPPRQPDPARWQVLVLDGHPLAPADADVRGAVAEAARRLQGQGARIMSADELPPGALPDLAVLHQAYQQWVMTVLGAFEPGAACALSAHDWIRLGAERGRLRAQCFALLERVDAILMPAFGCAAFAHEDDPDWAKRRLRIDGADTPYEAQAAWASLASLASLPATAVPVTTGAGGLPLGVQVVGPWLQDRGTIEVARRIAVTH